MVSKFKVNDECLITDQSQKYTVKEVDRLGNSTVYSCENKQNEG